MARAVMGQSSHRLRSYMTDKVRPYVTLGSEMKSIKMARLIELVREIKRHLNPKNLYLLCESCGETFSI